MCPGLVCIVGQGTIPYDLETEISLLHYRQMDGVKISMLSIRGMPGK